ncbi:MAG: hypothetical protein AAB845_01930 [Patescibacteria group bacterium]
MNEFERYYAEHMAGGKQEDAPDGWRRVSELMSDLGVEYIRIKELAAEKLQSHPEWTAEYLNDRGRLVEYYHPDLVTLIVENFRKNNVKDSQVKETVDRQPEVVFREETIRGMARIFGTSSKKIQGILQSFGSEIEHFKEEKPDSTGKKATFYSSEIVKRVSAVLEARPDRAPKDWVTKGSIAHEMGATSYRVNKIVRDLKREYPQDFRMYLNADSNEFEYLSPKARLLVEESISSLPKIAPDGWKTKTRLAKEEKIDDEIIEKITQNFRISNPEWFRDFRGKHNAIHEYYSPELISEIAKGIAMRPSTAPEGWYNQKQAGEKLLAGDATIREKVMPFRETHPEWFVEYTDSHGAIREYYHPELYNQLEGYFKNLPSHGGRGWFTVSGIAQELGVSTQYMNKLVNPYKTLHPEWFENKRDYAGIVRLHFSPDLVAQIKEIVNARPPEALEGWYTNNNLSLALEVSFGLVKKIASKYRDDHPEWFVAFRAKSQEVQEHFHPDLVLAIKQEVELQKKQ